MIILLEVAIQCEEEKHVDYFGFVSWCMLFLKIMFSLGQQDAYS